MQAHVPDYIQVAQGSSAFNPDFMGNRVPFPPEIGELLYHLGWGYTSGNIDKHGLCPGGYRGTGRVENHASACDPRKCDAVPPGERIPGQYPYRGHLQGQNVYYVWPNSKLRALGIIVYQTQSYAIVSSEVWPAAALVRIEYLDGSILPGTSACSRNSAAPSSAG